MSEKKPWKDSLWMDCLIELMYEYRQAGKAFVNFADVDARVIEKSKLITKYEMEKEEKK